MILEANTWQVFKRGGKSKGTGHTSFLKGWKYVEDCAPKALGVIHLGGHEDKEKGDGYGWVDQTWVDKVQQYVAAQGSAVCVHKLFQGTVLGSTSL